VATSLPRQCARLRCQFWLITRDCLAGEQRRGRELLNDVLGKDFPGVLVSDCLAIYDDATAFQQKLRPSSQAIRNAKDLHPQQGEGYFCELEAMLRAAVALQQQKADLNPEIFAHQRQTLENEAVQLLEPPPQPTQRRSRP
jgi:hypothetical protein